MSCWHGAALTLAFILFGHKKRTQGGKERRRSETLNPEGHLGTKAFTVSTVGRFPAFLFFYLREKIGRGWREKWAAMMAVQLHFFFFLPAHLVEENSLDLNVSYSN